MYSSQVTKGRENGLHQQGGKKEETSFHVSGFRVWDPPKQPFHAVALHDNTPSRNQTDEPQNCKNQNRDQQELRVMQEWQRVVSQKCDIGVVDQSGQVKRISQERGQEITR